mmetsp:Transcript_4600/g.6727  ORF Transcript_4600/g.6727 Transcript_4600/m.6727 type:complete len:84 (+) Transcript_4600:1218-1469(+)
MSRQQQQLLQQFQRILRRQKMKRGALMILRAVSLPLGSECRGGRSPCPSFHFSFCCKDCYGATASICSSLQLCVVNEKLVFDC